MAHYHKGETGRYPGDRYAPIGQPMARIYASDAKTEEDAWNDKWIIMAGAIAILAGLEIFFIFSAKKDIYRH